MWRSVDVAERGVAGRGSVGELCAGKQEGFEGGGVVPGDERRGKKARNIIFSAGKINQL